MNAPRADRTSAGPAVYAGLFFTTLSTLMYEIMLTRIFSVTMWYHFAFVAVSVALFGMTLGALIVHLWPRWFAVDIQALEKLPHFVTLPELRADPRLAGMGLLKRGNRLSVQPVTQAHFRVVRALGGLR